MSNFDIISKSFNLKEGGTLFDVDPAQMTPDTNFVFISLGGMGLITLSHIKTKITRECKLEKPTIVQYLAIDTETDLIKAYSKPNQGFEPFDNGEWVLLQDSIPQNILTLPMRQNLSENIKAWINPHLGHTVDQHGASGIRQVGRFFLSWPNNFNKVVSSLRRIKQNLEPGYKLQVYFIAGIAGGTGSGGFIDLGYLIREIFKIDGYASGKMLKAFLYLSDTRDLESQPIKRLHQYRNGCAALKELNYFMNLSKSRKGNTDKLGVDLSAKYSYTYPNGTSVSSEENIFDQCTLVTGADVSGITSSEVNGRKVKTEEATTIVTASSIVNQTVFADSVVQTTGTDQSFNAQISNLTDGDPKQAVNNAGRGELYPLNANFRYMACGYSETRLPVQECYAYASEMIFRAVNALYKEEINRFIKTDGSDADTVISRCKLSNLIAIEQKIISGKEFTSAKADMTSRPVFDQLKKQQERNPNTFDYEWGKFEKALETTVGIDDIVNDYTKKLKAELENQYKENPFRTIILTNLIDGEQRHKKCLVAQFLAMEEKIAKKIEILTRQVEHCKQDYEEALFHYDNAQKKRPQRDALFKAAEAKYKSMYDKFIQEKVFEAINNIYNNLLSEHDKYFKIYTTLLTTFKEVLEQNRSYLVDATVRKTGSSTIFSYDPAPLYAKEKNDEVTDRHDRLIKHIEDVVGNLGEQGVNQYAKDFMMQLHLMHKQWTELYDADERNRKNQNQNSENADVTIRSLVKSIRSFFNQKRTVLAQFTLERYLIIAYQGENDSEEAAMQNAADDIYKQLSTMSEPLYTTGNNYSLSRDLHELSYRALCVPSDASRLYTAICNRYDVQSDLSNNRIHIFNTSSSNAVYMYQIYCGLPAYILKQIEEMEEKYDESLNSGDCGTHLEENPANERVWRDFPMPMVREMWVRTQNPAKIPKKHEDMMKNRVHRCIERINELKILQMKDNPTNETKIFYAYIPDAIVNSGFEIASDEKGKELSGAKRFPEFDREAFVSKIYGRLSENNPEEYEINYHKLLAYYGDEIVMIEFNQTFGTFALKNSNDFELDLRGNLDRLMLFERLLRFYDYAMEPVEKVNEIIRKAVDVRDKIELFANAIIKGAISYDSKQSLWAFSNGLRLRNTVLFKLRSVRAFLLNKQAKTYLSTYYLYEGYRAFIADEEIVNKIIDFGQREDDRLIQLNDENPSQYDVEFDAREKKKEEMKIEVQNLLDSHDDKAGGLAYGGEGVRDAFIRLFAGKGIEDPIRSTPEYFNELVAFYQDLASVLEDMG